MVQPLLLGHSTQSPGKCQIHNLRHEMHRVVEDGRKLVVWDVTELHRSQAIPPIPRQSLERGLFFSSWKDGYLGLESTSTALHVFYKNRTLLQIPSQTLKQKVAPARAHTIFPFLACLVDVYLFQAVTLFEVRIRGGEGCVRGIQHQALARVSAYYESIIPDVLTQLLAILIHLRRGKGRMLQKKNHVLLGRYYSNPIQV